VIRLTIDDAHISASACAYNPDGTVARVHHTVVSHGFNIAYCDTEDEARRVIALLRAIPQDLNAMIFRFHKPEGWTQAQLDAFVGEVLAQAERSEDHPEIFVMESP